MAALDLQGIHDFMISIAKQAGERIVAAKPTTDAAGNKKNCNLSLPTYILCRDR
jgi:myo-inositol-1(or 4)-monophosphatase